MKFPIATAAIAISILAFFLILSSMLVFGSSEGIERFKFSFDEVQNIFFYNFAHVDYAHLLVNLAIIIGSGIVIERKLKSKDVVALFFAGSLFSALLFAALDNEYAIVGASAGAVALLTAAVAVDTKKALALTIGLMLLATVSIFAINSYIEDSTKSLKAQVQTLENTKEIAERENNTELAQSTGTIIEQKNEQIYGIEQGVELKSRIPASIEIHFFGSIFGAAYAFLFARKEILRNVTSLKKMFAKMHF